MPSQYNGIETASDNQSIGGAKEEIKNKEDINKLFIKCLSLAVKVF